MRILVLGWYYSSNLGDAVLCDCTAQLLRREYPDAEIVIRDLAGRTEFPDRTPVDLSGFAKIRRRQALRNFATRLRWDKQFSHEMWCLNQALPRMEAVTEGTWDLAVFAGGQLFMDDLALYTAQLTNVLAQKNVPVFFNACGTGFSVSPKIQAVLAKALASPAVRLVSCRDGKELVNQWCGKSIAVSADDPALWAGDVYNIEKSASRTIGLGVMYPGSLNPRAVSGFWKKVTGILDRDQIPWKFFTNGSEQDMAYARTLLDGRPEKEFLYPAPETPEELVRTVAGFRSLISFRLHSHIIACSLGIPTVALVWDQKIPGFFRSFHLKNRCFTLHTPPESVVSALMDAESAEYDWAIISSRRQKSRDLLLGAIRAL